MKVVEVDLGDRTYPIYIGRGLLDQGELLRQHIPGKTALIVSNETVAPLYLERWVGAGAGCARGCWVTLLFPGRSSTTSLLLLLPSCMMSNVPVPPACPHRRRLPPPSAGASRL